MTEPLPSPSLSPAIDRRWLAALAGALPLALVLLAPSPAEACRGAHRPVIAGEGPVTEDPALAPVIEREADGVLAPAPAGDGARPDPTIDLECAPRPAAAPAADPVAAPAAALVAAPAAPPTADRPCDRAPSSPNRDAARLLAIAGALLLALDLGVAAYRRRLRLAALIGAAGILAVGSLFYLVALSPWPNWPLMIVPAAAAAAIATRAMVNGR